MKINKKERVWKDSLLKAMGIWYFLILIVIFALFLILVWNGKTFDKIIMGLFLLISIYGFFDQITLTRVSLKINGILMGNIKFIRPGNYRIKQKNIFISWENIKKIRFENRLSGVSYIQIPRPFLFVITKDRKMYIYRVNDMPSFISALKKLNKYSLLDKNSKYK